MLRIQYLDKDRFMRQVAASKGSVYLHLDNGETCDLKQDSAATELFTRAASLRGGNADSYRA